MTIEILMPALSPTMEEGTLAKWVVKEGDSVSSGDVIAEIETDKATMEFEAVDEGTIGKIVVEEGTEGVKVNDLIAGLLEEGESADDIDDASAPSEESSSNAAPAEAPKEVEPAKGYGRDDDAASRPLPLTRPQKLHPLNRRMASAFSPRRSHAGSQRTRVWT